MKRILIVGCGGMTARWQQLVDPADYAIIASLNGAVTSGIPIHDAWLLDRNAPRYPWFRQACETATRRIHTDWATTYSFALAYAPDGVKVCPYGMESAHGAPEHWLPVAPQERGRVLLTGSVLHSALHYYIHEPDVTHIDLLGCECLFDEREDGTYYHFYDTERILEKNRQQYLRVFSEQRWTANKIIAYATAQGIAVRHLSAEHELEQAA